MCQEYVHYLVRARFGLEQGGHRHTGVLLQGKQLEQRQEDQSVYGVGRQALCQDFAVGRW